MNQLEEWRSQIDALDAQMAQLFDSRMQVCRLIAGYKKTHGIAVRDAARERAMLRARANACADERLRPYFCRLLKTMLRLSKHYQKRCMKEDA